MNRSKFRHLFGLCRILKSSYHRHCIHSEAEKPRNRPYYCRFFQSCSDDSRNASFITELSARSIGTPETSVNTYNRGVGLIEVMIALFILTFGALAIGNLQMTAMSSVTVSASHFAISSISEEVAEQLKSDSVQAANGTYNTTFAETTANTAMPAHVAAFINNSKQSTSSALANGALKVDCSASDCVVTLRWLEKLTTGSPQQFYNLKFPLPFN